MAVKKSKPQKPQSTQECGFCAYIGPNVRGIIQSGTIYPCSRSEILQQALVANAVMKYPEVAALIVQGNKLAEARTNIKTPGTLLYVKNTSMCARIKEET